MKAPRKPPFSRKVSSLNRQIALLEQLYLELRWMNEQVNEYIEKQGTPQKEILQKVRKLFQETLPNCEEKTGWGAITYAGGKFYIAAMKNSVHVGFAITGLNENEICLFEGSGKTMRHIKIPSLENINEEALVKLIELVDQKVICKSCQKNHCR
jgi:hypothetical protein